MWEVTSSLSQSSVSNIALIVVVIGFLIIIMQQKMLEEELVRLRMYYNVL